jgi:hypothetical protein
VIGSAALQPATKISDAAIVKLTAVLICDLISPLCI